MQSYSPSPSPIPASPPPNFYQGSSPAQQGGAGPPAQPQQQQPYAANGPGNRYSLINKLHHPQSYAPPHHPSHNHYSYPPSSPAYSNGPHSHQSPALHPGAIGPPLPHSAPHTHQPPPHQASHLHQTQGAGSPHPQSTGGNGVPTATTPHWAQQLTYASLSRQANSPHHHARAAHLAARGQTSAAIAITEPAGRMQNSSQAKPGGVNGFHHRSEGSSGGPGHFIARPQSVGPDVDRSSSAASIRTVVSSRDPREPLSGSPTSPAAGLTNGHGHAAAAGGDKDSKDSPSWTTIDMGGMSLKNVSPELFRYTFLTTLYLPHNSLVSLPASISRLSHLTLLDASSNKLTSLPPELGLLTRLRDLFLFDNHLSSLPPELGTLHLLETLGIEGNPLPETMRALLEKDGTSALIAYLRDSCPVPLPPPERDWVTVEPDSFPTLNPNKPPETTFSVLCYNILCEWYATASMYGYTPSWALAWDYRKELILQEVMNYGSDIICLQEVDGEQYEDYFLKHLSQQDYDGVYYPKSRARTMTGAEKRHVDGCATFFKNTTFALVEQQLIEFNQIALRRPDFKKTEDMFNRVMTKDHIAVVTLLENRASGARLIVANAHIHWDPEFRDVKLVQVAMLLDELKRIGNDFAKLPSRLNLAEGYDAAPTYTNGTKIPTIVCGDFNSIPDSGVYEFLSRGEVEKHHADFMGHDYGAYTSDGLNHRLALKSAYSHIGELPFTNYTPGFQGVIDYIFYTASSLNVLGLLGEVDREYIARQVGFPNAHTPSDHISLYSQFSFR